VKFVFPGAYLPIHAALVCVLLAGCSIITMKKEKSEKAWSARQARLLQIDRFALQARVSSGGLFGIKGNLIWRQERDASDIRVAGPFGVGATTITARGRRIEIRSAKGAFTTENPEEDLQKRLGWAFPVSHLRYWVLGTPAPGSEAEYELDEGGTIASLEQDGWQLEYDEYQETDAIDLPRKFTVSNDEVKIKVVVDTWSDIPALK
jgi:outer membrane lipoprotein LolB